MRNDANWLMAGAAGAVLLPILVFALGLPVVVSLPISLAVAAGLGFVLAPRRLFEGIDTSALGRGQVELVRKVLSDAEPSLERLRAAGNEIKSAGTRKVVAHLSSTAETIMKGVEASPERLSSVQRFLTYYLPSAAEISESYGVLEKQRAPDPARVRQTEGVISKLDEAFSHYADSLLESDLSNLDVELRLVERAVKEDIKAPT